MSNWNQMFNKDRAVFLSSGKEAITKALELLNAKEVAIPSYTCERVLQGTLDAGCKPHIVDCWFDLQINLDSLSKFKGDTVIVPHMFGIRAKVKEIKDMGYNVIEDCSQCLGLDGLGSHSDYVVVSVGSTKWLSVGTGGFLIGDGCEKVEFTGNYTNFSRAEYMVDKIQDKLKKRTDFANELINAGIDLIGKDMENAWMRGMYFTDNQKRKPYTPIHESYGNFKCPLVDGYKNKLDWISIFA